MALYVAICLLAALAAVPEGGQAHARVLGIVWGVTVGLALEVAGEGIRVNGVRQGIIDTDIHASGGIPDRAAQMASGLPIPRAGRAEEVAPLVCFLLSLVSSP